LLYLDKEDDGEEEGRGHKRKRKESSSYSDNPGTLVSFFFLQVRIKNFFTTLVSSSKRPKSSGDGKASKYGNFVHQV